MNIKDLEELALTPEEIASHWIDGSGYIHDGHYDMDSLLQAQLSNVIKALTEEKDKPDCEGRWWQLHSDLDEPRLRHIRPEHLENDNYWSGGAGYRHFDNSGKWIKAFVPEGGEMKRVYELMAGVKA